MSRCEGLGGGRRGGGGGASSSSTMHGGRRNDGDAANADAAADDDSGADATGKGSDGVDEEERDGLRAALFAQLSAILASDTRGLLTAHVADTRALLTGGAEEAAEKAEEAERMEAETEAGEEAEEAAGEEAEEAAGEEAGEAAGEEAEEAAAKASSRAWYQRGIALDYRALEAITLACAPSLPLLSSASAWGYPNVIALCGDLTALARRPR